jgi:hypothetical protein
MSELIERSIEDGAELIADGKTHSLHNLLVKFHVPIEWMTLIPDLDSPVPATAKTLVLRFRGMDTPVPVLREECEPSLRPADEHFHLKVPDPIHRKMIAKLVLAGESHLK